ncbi:GNAT family N-acetyltransferase [Niallia alba]|uniref:GNAT family N-acetyltransferase n=1 Tax=Niallia alba TaxID=2729105 RepID=A0A7Y0KA65_9BACI|nr:GNAT family N-acetyltransferase [Niallia alba]NMO78343.1 GNAT family N-acetyltransferase [Niallia alba]
MLLKSLGKNIYIKQPEWRELAFVEWLWADKDTMIDVGGTVDFKESRKVEWYRRMVQPTDKRNLYYLIYTYEDIPVGEVSFHRFDKEKGLAELNVKIAYKYRRKGYAKEAISLLLNYYFYEFNGEVMVDRVAKNNIPGQKLLVDYGFTYEDVSEPDIVLVKLTKEDFIKLSI